MASVGGGYRICCSFCNSCKAASWYPFKDKAIALNRSLSNGSTSSRQVPSSRQGPALFHHVREISYHDVWLISDTRCHSDGMTLSYCCALTCEVSVPRDLQDHQEMETGPRLFSPGQHVASLWEDQISQQQDLSRWYIVPEQGGAQCSHTSCPCRPNKQTNMAMGKGDKEVIPIFQNFQLAPLNLSVYRTGIDHRGIRQHVRKLLGQSAFQHLAEIHHGCRPCRNNGSWHFPSP